MMRCRFRFASTHMMLDLRPALILSVFFWVVFPNNIVNASFPRPSWNSTQGIVVLASAGLDKSQRLAIVGLSLDYNDDALPECWKILLNSDSLVEIEDPHEPAPNGQQGCVVRSDVATMGDDFVYLGLWRENGNPRGAFQFGNSLTRLPRLDIRPVQMVVDSFTGQIVVASVFRTRTVYFHCFARRSSGYDTFQLEWEHRVLLDYPFQTIAGLVLAGRNGTVTLIANTAAVTASSPWTTIAVQVDMQTGKQTAMIQPLYASGANSMGSCQAANENSNVVFAVGNQIMNDGTEMGHIAKIQLWPRLEVLWETTIPNYNSIEICLMDSYLFVGGRGSDNVTAVSSLDAVPFEGDLFWKVSFPTASRLVGLTVHHSRRNTPQILVVGSNDDQQQVVVKLLDEETGWDQQDYPFVPDEETVSPRKYDDIPSVDTTTTKRRIIMPPIVISIGLIGGVLWWRLRRSGSPSSQHHPISQMATEIQCLRELD